MENTDGNPKKVKGDISQQIEALLAALDMKPLHLANKTGIANETIYRCLNGVRKWNLKHLEIIAPHLGVTVADLIQKSVMVPRAGEVKEGRGPTQSQILHPSPEKGSRVFPAKENRATLAKLYDLTVADRSMTPTFPPGSILTAQRDTADLIQNEDFVIYWSDDGQTYVRQILLEGDHIVLRSLTQGVPDKLLPASQLALCNKILQVKFTA